VVTNWDAEILVSADPSPENDVAVTMPVTVTPLGKDGAPVPVLFLIESTFNCDISLLLF